MQIGAATPVSTPTISRYSGPGEVTSTELNQFTPADINSIHQRTKEAAAPEPEPKSPRILNTAMNFLSRLGRWGTGLIAACGGIFTALSLFLFNAKVAILCALPTLAAIAGFIKLKPKTETFSSVQPRYKELLEQVASSDDRIAKPQFILSRADELIKALENVSDNWGSLNQENRFSLYMTIRDLKGKILPIHEEYKERTAKGKEGLAELYPNCSLKKLDTMLELLTDLEIRLARKIHKTQEQIAQN